jgi:hypothetical protein
VKILKIKKKRAPETHAAAVQKQGLRLGGQEGSKGKKKKQKKKDGSPESQTRGSIWA